jgi:dGTPase
MDWSKYLSAERARQHDKVGAINDCRSPFESDYGRVLFSSAIRRMHDKTQVIPLTNGDAILTRLTHSIQVMNIAESLILNYTRSKQFIEENPDPDKRYDLVSALTAIVRSAAFVHDVGNPPFGHFGETVIQEFFNRQKSKQNHFCATTDDEKNIERKSYDFTQFDGNAQGLRILSRLQYIGALDGLNLTFATLAAFMKYPNTGPKKKDDYIGNKKHGVFFSEEPLFNRIVESCNMRMSDGKIKRHPLSYIVEASDSIAYLTMDIEDAYNLKWLSFDDLHRELNRILNKARKNNEPSKDVFRIINYNSRGFKDGELIEGANRKAIVDFRVNMIQYLVNLAVNNFLCHIKEVDAGTYNKELIDDDMNGVAAALLEFSQQYIYARKEICSEEMTGRTVLNGLLEMLSLYAFSEDNEYRNKVKSVISRSRLEIAVHENSFPEEEYKFFTNTELYGYDIVKMGSYGRWRMIVDFVSSMTDKYAVYLYQQLSGNRL